MKDKIEAVAEAWASIDGKLEKFEYERDDAEIGSRDLYLGYMIEAEELLKRIEKRGFILARLPKK